MKKHISILLFLFCVFAIPASAHQPSYVENKSAILDSEPTISKAYYGELDNQPTIYTINSTSTFDMYVNILSPDIPGATKDFVVIIKNGNNIIKTISGSSADWVKWHEDFAGDWYWKGPEFKSQLPAGDYTISVQNPTNSGKYVLAIGEVESFPVNQFSNTLKELFAIKTGFFGEPWYGIFYGIIGKFLLGGTIISLIILIAVVLVIVRVIRKRR